MEEQVSKKNIIVRITEEKDVQYSSIITKEMGESAKIRGTGIAKRSVDYINKKITQKQAVIAVVDDGTWAGFSYIEAWGHEKFIANSGLIVAPQFRKEGVAKAIKTKIFKLSRGLYPNSKIFGLTTGSAVMKINSQLGYVPVSYQELTDDAAFWEGCKSCVNYHILESKQRKNCMCTAMLFSPPLLEKSPDDITPKEKVSDYNIISVED